MRVSALITNYNYDRYLAAAIGSALQQTHANAEVVVVDDGSTDNSRSIIHKLMTTSSGRMIGVFQENGGQAAAINAGFLHCSGDIICMLDADDLWDRTHIERVAKVFEKDSSVAMVANHYRTVDTAGKVVFGNHGPASYSGDWDQMMLETGAPWLFGATSGLSFSRRAMEQILPIPAARWRLCADGALAFAAVFIGKTVVLPDSLGTYRMHGYNNHAHAKHDPAITQADVEMTNRYINDFLARIGRRDRVDLEKNLFYRRDRFYRNGGGLSEAIAIVRLISSWPLYRGPIERSKFLGRFILRAIPRLIGRRARLCHQSP